MDSCGIDRATGLPLTDLAHVAQSVETIFSTRLGEMIMRRQLAGGVAELLGRAVTPRLLTPYRALLALSIDTWEPRLRVAAVRDGGNTVMGVTFGELRFDVMARYRPRALLGDFSMAPNLVRFGLGSDGTRIVFAFDGVA